MQGKDIITKIEHISEMGIFEWWLDEDHLSCSDNFIAITGLKSTNNLIHKDIFIKVIAPNYQNYALNLLHESITHNKPFEVSFFTQAEKPKKLRLFGYPEGNIERKCLTGLIQDITYKEDLSKSLIHGQDQERKRLSLELHDGIGQRLIAIKYKLALFTLKQDESHLLNVNEAIDSILDEVRSITHNLSTQIITELGLEKSINQILEETMEVMGASGDLTFEIAENQLSELAKKMIYRIAQEAFSNITKYSRASHISFKISLQNNQIIITIADNGIGFNKIETSKNGIGLQNIKERVSILNGNFEMNTAPSKGTVLKIRFPTG